MNVRHVEKLETVAPNVVEATHIVLRSGDLVQVELEGPGQITAIYAGVDIICWEKGWLHRSRIALPVGVYLKARVKNGDSTSRVVFTVNQ